MFVVRMRQFFLALICFGLLVFTSACDSATPASVTSHNDGPVISSTGFSTATPTPVLPVQTSCPAAGSARAAIMPPIPAGSQGKDQNILYTYMEQSHTGFTSILKRYDVTTGKKRISSQPHRSLIMLRFQTMGSG